MYPDWIAWDLSNSCLHFTLANLSAKLKERHLLTFCIHLISDNFQSYISAYISQALSLALQAFQGLQSFKNNFCLHFTDVLQAFAIICIHFSGIYRHFAGIYRNQLGGWLLEFRIRLHFTCICRHFSYIFLAFVGITDIFLAFFQRFAGISVL